MDENKKPSMLAAVLLTIATVCILMSFLLKATGGTTSGGLLIFQLFTAGLLTFCAIVNWVVYFKRYVNFEVKKRLKEENKK
jgi:hypothetical protein